MTRALAGPAQLELALGRVDPKPPLVPASGGSSNRPEQRGRDLAVLRNALSLGFPISRSLRCPGTAALLCEASLALYTDMGRFGL
mmetsp:Transcript_122324/g.237942  ORF Transcript_122324/g.237942 Transcript_122324/m.237942 type:complete len:85 (+) Transcript_122324:399-653(+)|eukprot:CAMPEP_0172694798 /NCGR_PEP_ID=MMETSP1074-20121228/26914_1 /TAXON_ID=2916 /ORGANISM="Ceratium fusus, Strain PA161109" /LENGTH=84 /DNA_ID=CAMNT_0013515331 /DNA_START=356 /DNA_END=610 /DNA_ORIENTATION=+